MSCQTSVISWESYWKPTSNHACDFTTNEKTIKPQAFITSNQWDLGGLELRHWSKHIKDKKKDQTLYARNGNSCIYGARQYCQCRKWQKYTIY